MTNEKVRLWGWVLFILVDVISIIGLCWIIASSPDGSNQCHRSSLRGLFSSGHRIVQLGNGFRYAR